MTHRVAFIHGRPGPHPMHSRFARSIDADFFFVDTRLRWQLISSNPLRRYLSWFLTALFFPNFKEYSVFLTEGPQFPPILMKWLRRLNANQKVSALLGNETLYFLAQGRYSKPTTRLLTSALCSYDALVCIGQMQADLAKQLFGSECPPIYTVFNSIPRERFIELHQAVPKLDGRQIVFVGNGPDGWRVWYKGLDVLLESFRLCFAEDSTLRLVIVGDWEARTVRELLRERELLGNQAIQFMGGTGTLGPVFSNSSLYLHCARGEAWGISILEAMCAGIPSIVSEWTGAREVVEQVSSNLIVPLDARTISQRIEWYFALSSLEREALSVKARNVAAQYSEERALAHFRATFDQMLNDLALAQ